MARAAKAAGVHHVIWSTLEDTRDFIPLDDDRMPTLGGRFKVPHYDAKGEANDHFTDAGVPVTFLQTSFYWENFIYFGMGPQRGEDGGLSLTFPIGDGRRIAGIAAADIGAAAYGVFKAGRSADRRNRLDRRRAPHRRGDGGRPSPRSDRREGHLQRGHARGLPRLRLPRGRGPGEHVPVLECDFEAQYAGARDRSFALSLYWDLQDFDAWLAANASRIPLGT